MDVLGDVNRDLLRDVNKETCAYAFMFIKMNSMALIETNVVA